MLDEKTMRVPRNSAARFSTLTARAILAPLLNRGIPMLKYELRQDDGMLVLHPEGPLEAADFTTLARDVDAYLKRHGVLRGVLIRAKSFPGWKDFGALLAHLKFLKAHLRRIEKVAIVADGSIATLMPNIAKHFVHAQVQHFDLAHEDAAWIWLEQSGNAELRPAA
ncbi:MAG: STAS/SEC14 domain-containing protein [Burkholderiales bacterium]|nr:STAS/SEC14 domain-containing protein [Burkholderiales bacterium]